MVYVVFMALMDPHEEDKEENEGSNDDVEGLRAAIAGDLNVAEHDGRWSLEGLVDVPEGMLVRIVDLNSRLWGKTIERKNQKPMAKEC